MRILLLWCAILLLAGCDGLVGIEGWAVKSVDGKGNIVVLRDRPVGVPEGALDSVTVELWTEDGKRLLDQTNSKSGYFEAGFIGPYQPGMRYLVKASAPGFKPLSQKVRLDVGGNWARIEFVPKPK